MIIFDLDGTLADIEHRRFLIAKVPRGPAPDWRAFYKACILDRPIVPVIRVLRALYVEVSPLEIWSGRSDEVLAETKVWIEKNIFYDVPRWNDPTSLDYVRLRMRPEGNFTPDDVLKETWLNDALAQGERVEFVFDDRQKVVEMWRRRGVVCFQTAKGDF